MKEQHITEKTDQLPSREPEDDLRRYEQLVSTSSELASFIDTSFTHRAVNDVYLDFFQTAREDLVGRTVEETTGEDLFESVLKPRLERCLSGSQVNFQLWWSNTKHGRRLLDFEYQPVRSVSGWVAGILAIVRDMTEGKRASDTLRQSEQRFRDFSEIVGDWLWELDAGLRFTYLSKPFEALTGEPSERYLGRRYQTVMESQCDDPESWKRHTKDVSARRPFEKVDFRWAYADGTARIVSMTGRPLFSANSEFLGYRGVGRNVTDSRILEQQRSDHDTRDSVTGLMNRRALERCLQKVLVNVHTDPIEYAFCYLDLDQFKVINDACGHVAGDELLRQVGELLAKQLEDGDTLAYLGGDEFGVLLHDCTVPEARRRAGNMRKSFTDFRFSWDDKRFIVAVSIGVVPITAASSDIGALLRKADTACYVAKETGGDRIHAYDSNDPEQSQRNQDLRCAALINQALEQDRFHLNVQPIVPIKQSEDAGLRYEVLLRMDDDEEKAVSPEFFVPVAERYNLATKIDRWVIHSTFGWLADNPEHQERLQLCLINLSAHSIVDERFLEFVCGYFDEGWIKPDPICFEITETAAVANLSRATRFMIGLKVRGCRFALDNFGSGLSSFKHLKNLPVDYLTIDGGLIRGIVDDPDDQAMVKSINEMAHLMGKTTIAEYVENESIFNTLKEIGVDYVQGNYFGRADSIDRMT